MSLLTSVQENCQKVAEAVASALKMEVEIIDNELLRVAGTGSVRIDVGYRLRRGFVNKHVLNISKPVFIDKAGFHQICGDCPLKGNCFYKASIVYPIEVNDRGGVITHFNRSAERIFRIKKENALGRDVRQVLPGIPLQEVLQEGKEFSSREVFLNPGNKKLHLLSTARIVRVEEGSSLGVVASFRYFIETQKLAYEYISAYREITFDDIIGSSPALEKVKRQAQKIADSNSTVIILGETRTGKELFARPSTPPASPPGSPLWPSTAGQYRRAFWKANCSGTTRGPLRAPEREESRGNSSWPTGAPFFWTKSATCPCIYSPNCSGFFRKRPSSGWAAPRLFRWTSG